MQLTGIDLLFWAASFAGHVTLLIVLVVKRRTNNFPVFTAFVAAAIFRTITLFCMERYGTRAEYFYTFWSFAIAIDVLLQLGIVIETFFHIFRRNVRIPKDVREHLLPWTVCSVLAAVALTWLAKPDAHLDVQRTMIRGNLFSSLLMSELLAGMVALSFKAGLPMRTHVARICEGFGVYSLVGVLIEAGHTYFGLRRGDAAYIILSHFRIALYLACLGYWVVTLWRDAPSVQEPTNQIDSKLRQVSQSADASLHGVRARRLP